MEKPISIKLAKEISIKKWEEILNGFDTNNPFTEYSVKFLKEYPEELSNNLRAHYNCGFCYRHGYSCNSWMRADEICEDCEFGKVAGICPNDISLYSDYHAAKDDYEDNLDDIDSDEIVKEIIERGIEIVEEIIETIKQIDENEI